MAGYLTPGELATLRSRKSAMIRAEHMIACVDHPTDDEIWDALDATYGGGWDDSTDLRQRSVE